MTTRDSSERVTADTFRKHLSAQNVTVETLIDDWLFYDVLPNFKNTAQGYEIPANIGSHIDVLTFAEKLEQRGFSVTKHADHQGSFVYLSLPPDNE